MRIGRTCSAALAVMLCFASGCAGTNESAGPVVVASDNEGRIGDLRARRSLDSWERVELGELELAAGNFSAAERTLYGAMNRGDLSRSDLFRVHYALGLAAEGRGDPHAARPRLQEAWRLAGTDLERDRALIPLARADLDVGDFAQAKTHRDAVKERSLAGFAVLDRRVAAATAGAPAPAARPEAVVGAGLSMQRAKGRGLKAPPIVARATWGARPHKNRDVEPLGKPLLITLHHTADLRPPGPTYEDTLARMRAYQNGHQNDNGWADIGYHFVIDKAGRIVEGRPMHLKGAHAGSIAANEHNVGIAMIGNFQTADPTPKQYESLEDLVVWLSGEYSINEKKIYTHHQIKDWPGVKGATNCPGKRFDPFFARLKKAVAAASKATAARN